MTIAKMNLDESTKLDFGVAITGADGKPDARFVIEGKDFSVSFPCTPTNEGVEAEIKGLSKIFTAGTYNVKLEVVLENKIYTPLVDKIEFEPSISITTESKVVKPVKESVKVASVTIKKPELTEEQRIRKNTAEIIAELLEAEMRSGTPVEIVNSALIGAGELSEDITEQLNDLLTVAESVGIEFDTGLRPATKIVQVEILENKPEENKDDGWSEQELDHLTDQINDWEDIADVYDINDLVLIDADTGEIIDDLKEEMHENELNEVLSRAERIRARIRFHKSEGKRERKIKLALRHRSSSSVLNARARKLAIKTMKLRLAKKPLNKLSINEKERIERIVMGRKNVINRLSLKMLSKVRKIEKDRLGHIGA